MSVVYYSSYKDSAERYRDILGPDYYLKFNLELSRWEVVKGVPPPVAPPPKPVEVPKPPPPPVKPLTPCEIMERYFKKDVRTLIGKTEEGQREHGFLICEDYTRGPVCVGTKTSVDIEDCKLKGSIGMIHAHLFGHGLVVKALSRTDYQTLLEEPPEFFSCIGYEEKDGSRWVSCVKREDVDVLKLREAERFFAELKAKLPKNEEEVEAKVLEGTDLLNLVAKERCVVKVG